MPTLRFQVLGFPVAVDPSYWFLTALLGFSYAQRSWQMAVATVFILLFSILVHELGHALAARSFGLSPQIRLHMMGGTTAFAPGVELSRGRDILVSLAGPFAGFFVGAFGAVFSMVYAPVTVSGAEVQAPSLFVQSLDLLVTINLFWGAVNLIPVTPLDGGRVLAALLGPAKKQLFATISLMVGLFAAFFFLQQGFIIGAMFFGLFAVSGFFRARQEGSETVSDEGAAGGIGAPPIATRDQGLSRALSAAERALNAGAHSEAITLAEGVLGGAQTAEVARRGLNVLLWAQLAQGDSEAAFAALKRFPEDTADPYAAGAALEAAGELEGAKRVLDQARGHGDKRLPMLGLLIQVLLKQQDYAGAAELTEDIVDKIAPDDARRVASEVEEAGDHAAAGRVHLAVARAERSFRDASSAVIAFAQTDSRDGLLAAYKLAKSYDGEGSRRLLSDERLGDVRSLLESAG